MWLFCNTQWRASAFAIIGIDYLALLKIAEILDVSIDSEVLYKIKALELYELQRNRKEEGNDE